MTHISHAFFICFFTQPDILFLLSDWGSAQSRCSHWTVMSFRSYSQEAPTNSEPFSLDEAFNLFPPESFTLSLAVLDFSHHYFHQWPGFVHSIEGTFPSSLVLNKLITPWHQHISPQHYPVLFNRISKRNWTLFSIPTESLILVGGREGMWKQILRSFL